MINSLESVQSRMQEIQGMSKRIQKMPTPEVVSHFREKMQEAVGTAAPSNVDKNYHPFLSEESTVDAKQNLSGDAINELDAVVIKGTSSSHIPEKKKIEAVIKAKAKNMI